MKELTHKNFSLTTGIKRGGPTIYVILIFLSHSFTHLYFLCSRVRLFILPILHILYYHYIALKYPKAISVQVQTHGFLEFRRIWPCVWILWELVLDVILTRKWCHRQKAKGLWFFDTAKLELLDIPPSPISPPESFLKPIRFYLLYVFSIMPTYNQK